MNLEIKNTRFLNLIPSKITDFVLEDLSRPQFNENNLKEESFWLTASTGGRTLVKLYSYDELQSRLTEHMDSIGADENDTDRNLMLVLARERYYVLENALSSDLFPAGFPRIEEASKVTRRIFRLLMKSLQCEYYMSEEDAKKYARKNGYSLNEIEEALAKDIERFNLQDVMFLHKYGTTVSVNAGFISSFSGKDKDSKKMNISRKTYQAKVIACDYAIQIPLFSENDSVYIYVKSGKRNRILSFSFTELQERLNKYMEDTFEVDSADRDLDFVLKNKHYAVLAGALEKELYQEIPSLKRSSKPLKLLFHRLLDSPGMKFFVTESETESFAKAIGLTWCQLEEQLKKDIEYYGLKDVFRFHDADYALVVSDKLLSYFST